MASSLKSSVMHWRKKLEHITDDDYTILNVIHKLSKVPVTVDLLQDTGIGKVIRNLAKRTGKVGVKASAVLHSWRKVVASAQKSPDHSTKTPHVKHNSLKRESSHNDSMGVANFNVPSSPTYKKKSGKDKKSPELKYGQELEYASVKSKDISVKKASRKQEKQDVHYSNSRSIHLEKHRYSPDVSPSDNMTSIETEVDYEEEHHNSTSDMLNIDETYSVGKRKHCSTEEVESAVKRQKTGDCGLPITQPSRKEVEKESSHNSHKKKEKEKKSSSTKAESDKISSKKSQSHKHSVTSSDAKKLKEGKTIKIKEVEKKSHSELKKTLKLQSTDAFTSSEVRFEDCLSFNDIVPFKKKKICKTSSSTIDKKAKCVSEKKKTGNDQLKPKHVVNADSSSKISKPKEHTKGNVDREVAAKLSQSPIPRAPEVDIVSTLPQPQLNYRPLPQRNFDFFPSKRKALSNEDAIKFTSSKREKTAVYSGRKNNFFTTVPSLFESCTRILIENIDAIEYLGGVPYYLLKPVLERCTPHQLENIEDYNPDLLVDTHELWETHCKKDFRSHEPQENETWRDLYLRAFDEREKKLKTLTKNISNSMSKSNTGRLVKLTYVNSFVKPPRDVARKQIKNGTGLPVNHTMKAGPPSKATPRPTAPAINAAATSNAKPDFVPKNMKPKVAPLMAKTLKSMKQCFRR